MIASLKWILAGALCALIQTTFAQTEYNSPTSTSTQTNRSSKDGEHSRQFAPSKNLVGATVKDPRSEKLGEIDEILINPKTGQTLASIGVGQGRYALVPLQAFTVAPPRGALRNAEISLNSTKEALQAGPTVGDNEWRNLDSPSFVQRIYSHYNVRVPSAVGGTSEGSMGGSSTGAGSRTNHQAAPITPQLPQPPKY